MSNISQIQDAEGPGTSQSQGVGVFRCVVSWPRFSVWPQERWRFQIQPKHLPSGNLT